jgi:hypothetical protein
MYGSMSKIKNKPLTNSLWPFSQEKWSETTRKTICENCETTNLPETAGNGYTANVPNADLTEPWRDIEILRMDFDQNRDRHVSEIGFSLRGKVARVMT